MQGDDFVHALHGAVLDHGRGSANAVGVERLLGRLEEQAHIAAPCVLFCDVALVQQMRHAQQHGRVRVVAAGMHDAVVGGLERHVHLLEDGQRVHIGADAEGRAVAGADLRHHAGATDAGLHVFVADLGQRVGHQLRGAHLLEAQFRVFVDVAAQAHHFVLQGFGLV